VAETLASLVLLFWWYHLDKEEHAYQAGKLMNAGVLVLAVAALPVYFIRSRGWKRGTRTLAMAVVFLAATLALGEMGERLGAFLTRASGAA
jgi:membrane-associated PAP2 superfamily phosphatase